MLDNGLNFTVASAEEELKQHATEIIGSNEEDSVVKYLIERA